jgi:hypothetical protein
MRARRMILEFAKTQEVSCEMKMQLLTSSSWREAMILFWCWSKKNGEKKIEECGSTSPGRSCEQADHTRSSQVPEGDASQPWEVQGRFESRDRRKFMKVNLQKVWEKKGEWDG